MLIQQATWCMTQLQSVLLSENLFLPAGLFPRSTEVLFDSHWLSNKILYIFLEKYEVYGSAYMMVNVYW